MYDSRSDPDFDRKPDLWRPLDKQLRKDVPDQLVQNWLRGASGDSRRVDEATKQGGAWM